MANNRLSLLVASALLVLLALRLGAQPPEEKSERKPAATSTETPAAGRPAPASSAAAKADAKSEEPPTEAETALDEAIARVRKLQSVSADITEKVDMLNQSFELKGEYLKGPGHLVRLELTLYGMPDTRGTHLSVCDGRLIWDFQQILDPTNKPLAKNYRKRELEPILKVINDPEFDPTSRDQVITQLGFAGPDSLLTGLRRSIRFDQKEDGTLDKLPVDVLRGRWKDPNVLLPPNQPRPNPNLPLPDFLPSLVTLWVGKEDGWPYKLEFTGRKRSELEGEADNEAPPRIEPDGRPASNSRDSKVRPVKIVLTYSNVKINPTLKPERFAFQVPKADERLVFDETQTLVTQLKQGVQAMSMMKKAAAAKEGETPPAPEGGPEPPR